MEILENPGKGQKEARRGQEEARKKREEAREARKRPEEARKRPEEARKRPGRGQSKKKHQNARNPEFGEKLLETQCVMNRKSRLWKALNFGDFGEPRKRLKRGQEEARRGQEEARKRPGKG